MKTIPTILENIQLDIGALIREQVDHRHRITALEETVELMKDEIIALKQILWKDALK